MSETSDDLSAVAWVHEELRKSLESAHKALRRFGKEVEAAGGSDIDAIDPSVLRQARAQLHQGVGALELVGLPACALVLRSSESLVQKAAARPQMLTPAVIADIERASFALLDFLGRMLVGRPASPLSLFPQYRAVQDAAEAHRVHPADLWSVDWRWREVAADGAAPRAPDAGAHDALEDALLALMRGKKPEQAAARISDLCAGLAAGASDPEVATMWRLAAGVFQAHAARLLGFDLYTKRVASRLLAQFRILERGESDVSERLARDLLFFCSQSAPPPAGQHVPRLAAVRQAYALPDEPPVDYSASVLGRFDPALIANARKRVAAAKEAWSSVAGGELHRLPGLNEQFSLVGDSLKKLFPHGDSIADELQMAVVQTQHSGAAPSAPLAMEVATSLLYIDAALEDADFDDPEHAGRVRRLAERLARVRGHHPPEPLEAWMEELYRRVSDRQTMGSVVQELRASLLEAEKAIDQFFRNPAESKVLIEVPKQLSAMRGVLSVLGMEHAAAALLRMRDEVDGLISTEIDPLKVVQTGLFDRLAGNLSALGFLIDMLSVQPQLAKSLFAYDAEQGTLSPVMGRAADSEHMNIGLAALPPKAEPRLVEQAQLLAFTAVREDVPLEDVQRDLERLAQEAQAADQAKLAAALQKAQIAFRNTDDDAGLTTARGELSEALVDFVATASEPPLLEPQPSVAPSASPVPARIVDDFQDDDEMREVFLEEAREVVRDARAACQELARAPDDLGLLTTIRRAFHTLKGSSRMVGLKVFGEAAWTCEQLYNSHLAEQRPAEPPFVEFTAWALDYLGAWVEEIGARGAVTHEVATVKARAQLVAQEMPAPGSVASDVALPLGLPAGTPSPADLELAPAPATATPPALPSAAAGNEGVAFELDLSSLDAPSTSTAHAWSPAQPALDPDVQALFDPFETQALPGHGSGVDLEVGEVSGPGVDVELADAEPEAPLVHALAPTSERGALDEAPAAARAETAPPAIDLADTAPHDEGPDTLPFVDEVEPPAPPDEELVKVVGPLRISIPLFNIYLNEADELSRRLQTEVAEWAMELHRPVGETAIALAHSLAGTSATVGFADLSHLARALEHALTRSHAIGDGTHDEARLFVDTAEEIRRLLHQFAAGFLKEPASALLARLAEHEVASAKRLEAKAAALAARDSTQGTLSPPLARLPDPDDVETAPAHLGVHPDEIPTAPAGFDVLPEEARLRLEEAPLVPPLEGLLEARDVEPEPPAAVRDERDERERGAEPAAVAQPAVVAAPFPDAPSVVATPSSESPASVVRPFASSRAGAFAVSRAGALDGDAGTDDAPHDAQRSSFGALGLGPAELKALPALPVAPAVAVQERGDDEDDIDAQDAVDAELFPIFEEEGLELIPQLASQLRTWAREPAEAPLAAACMRTLHTLKGGARLAGAMRLGEMAHRLEARIERLLAHPPIGADDVEALEARCDALASALEVLRARHAADAASSAHAPLEAEAPVAPAPEVAASTSTSPNDAVSESTVAAHADPTAASFAAPSVDGASGDADATSVPHEPVPEARADAPSAAAIVEEPPKVLAPIDWSRFPAAVERRRTPRSTERVGAGQAVRVGAPLLDRLVNLAGEVSITRSRVESGVAQIKSSLADLTENLERLRGQLRDIEIQGETQMSSRLEAAKAAQQAFDPLEFDRFTRFQELTRMMAEAVNDVATVQRNLQRSLDGTEDELVAQARMTRELQDDLLRTRMVEFEGLSDRLYRVVRQAAKETGKQVRLDIVGGSIEVDRGVLDRMTGSFEHLLRNCVTHGIEAPEARVAAGKDATGAIVVALSQEGNEVGVEVRDDGGGLDLPRIRAKGVEMGLVDPHAQPSDAELANLIFTPGFSTASSVTELAGRGVGMDVVRSEVVAMGGRIETATEPGKGTSFKLILPLTTAVTQVVMLRTGASTVAVPSTLVETVRRATPADIDAAYASGTFAYGDRALPFFWMGALLQLSARPDEASGRTRSVVIVRSAQQRIAVHVDEVVGNQEVVVKNLGPQLSRLPGLAGMTLLPSGAVALIYNPVALAALYGEGARAATAAALRAPSAHVPVEEAPFEAPVAPLVLVVDDSLTVRRVTQRLLAREGYRVALAKDGLEALERLAEEKPRLVLSDIEMPRMDGFDLVRNIRNDARWRELPVIMITSRIAQKHRDHAMELGVDHYLGKPYSEEDLLALIGRYTAAAA